MAEVSYAELDGATTPVDYVYANAALRNLMMAEMSGPGGRGMEVHQSDRRVLGPSYDERVSAVRCSDRCLDDFVLADGVRNANTVLANVLGGNMQRTTS